MPSEIFLKNLNLSIELETSIVKYSEYQSESGTYIFAPGLNGRELRIRPLDAYIMEGSISTQVIVFYKSIYKTSCFAVMTIQLDKVG